MKNAAKLPAAVRNRDRLIERLGDSLERYARAIDVALRQSPDEGRTALRRLARGIRAGAREVRWIGSGRLDTPRLRRLDLVAVVREAAAPWAQALERRGASLSIEARPARIVGLWDRAHLEAIVGELLSNACKHGGGKPVTLRIDASARTRVTLAFEDPGRGPAPRRPFMRFSRGPNAAGEGMGVGLWLTEALATQGGGGLRFTRGRGGGTRAVVTLSRDPRLRGP